MNYWLFAKNAKTILLLKRALGIPYVNRIDFFAFCVYKTFHKKIGFCIWMKISMTAIVERQRARLYTQKAKKLRNVFIYKKSYTWRYGIFMKFLKLAFIFKKHDTLRYVTFLYTKKLDTSQKARQFAIRFYIQKSGSFALRDFSLNFWNLRRGGDIYWLKKNVLCVTLLYWKNSALCVTLLYTKSLTLCVTF